MKKISKEKQDQLKDLLISKGATKVGFADLQNIPNLNLKYFSGISILVKLNPEIILNIKKGPTSQYCYEYSRVNYLLDSLGKLACNFLIESGYPGEASKATIRTTELENFNINIPHKTLATLSGIGWIGKNALLTTEEFGSAVRLTSVFTNAIFKYDDPIKEVKCGNCIKCKNICPANAILGQNWYIDIDLPAFYNPELCRNTIKKFISKDITKAICGICIANCPYTRKYFNQNNQ